MTGNVLVAIDLDQTLIYSTRAVERSPDASVPVVCVEIRDGRQVSFMTAAAAVAMVQLARHATLVPATTRVEGQLARVRLPGPAPRLAVAANGGLLLVDGVADRAWSRRVAAELGGSFPFAAMWEHVGRVCGPEWTTSLRDAHGLFCYAVVDLGLLPVGFVAEAAAWADERGWRTCLQGRKLYWLPKTLTKGAAVAEIARRTGAEVILAAGDSRLDVDLLTGADLAIHPSHGELWESGWSAPNVSRTSSAGVRAGQEIVEWLSARALAHRSGSALPPERAQGELGEGATSTQLNGAR